MNTKFIVILLTAAVVLTAGCGAVPPEKAETEVRALLEKTVNKNRDLRHGILLVHSDRLDIHWKFAYGTVSGGKQQVTEDHTYHIASIGKTMTSVVISRLYEEGKISFDDPIRKFLPEDILNGLHVYEGNSYSDEILVRHLLNHTSGIADYFEEKPEKGKSILELAVDEPDCFWTPLETIQWAKNNLEAHFPPGEGFHYSDTGYQLLGLIIEEITGRPMHESLHEYIFQPLNMKHTYQLFYSDPVEESPYPMADLYLDRDEVSTFRSISVDWAGGGIVSNTEDLLLFHRALVNSSLLEKDTFNKWKDWAKFGRGIDYGYGLVSLKFKQMMFFLPEELDMWGNWGSTAAFMFYNPSHDVYVIGAFNQTNLVKKQVQFMIKVINIVSKSRGE